MPKTEETPNGWMVDVSDITIMQPVFDWNKAVRTGDGDAMKTMMSKRIKTWPFELDPSKETSYGQLTPKQWLECQKKVGEAISGVFQEAGNAD